MGRILRHERHTIRHLLEKHFRMMTYVVILFSFSSVVFALSSIKQSNDALIIMNTSNTLFDEVRELELIVENHLAYAEGMDQRQINELLLGIHEQLDLLKHADIDDAYFRSLMDIEEAIDTAAEMIFAIPDTKDGLSALRLYYEQDYSDLQFIFEGIKAYEPIANNRLLMAGVRIHDELNRQFIQWGFGMAVLILSCIWAIRNGKERMEKKIIFSIENFTNEVIKECQGRFEEVHLVESNSEEILEIYKLTEAFNEMIKYIVEQYHALQEKANIERKLKEQKIQNIEMENLLKTSQMQALQRQINPHFLFNTLNIILNTAYMEDALETADLLSNTAAYLRYALDCCEKRVTLGRELETLEKYVYLQEKRFGHRIRFYFDIDEELNNTSMPALILQPLVENAIAHGVGNYLQDGKVCIDTFACPDNRMCICIRDNGMGMHEEELHTLRVQIQAVMEGKEDAAGSIGLPNVAKRLFVFYNGQAKVEIHSKQNAGCQIKLILPLRI